eukprot:6192427-Pleurochrysis_carterae.AAC.1
MVNGWPRTSPQHIILYCERVSSVTALSRRYIARHTLVDGSFVIRSQLTAEIQTYTATDTYTFTMCSCESRPTRYQLDLNHNSATELAR